MYLRSPVAMPANRPLSRARSGARNFHRTLPGYGSTPLVDLPKLAAEVGVGQVLVKDESRRLDLPAFKILGASWAICRTIQERRGLAEPADLDRLRAGLVGEPVTFMTATDGNHGRAVARMAKWLDVRAHVYVPAQLDEATVALIADEGATVTPVAGGYDAAVGTAAEAAQRAGALLIQDTAWPGYEQIPGWIVEGYTTMLAEIDEHAQPDLIIVPAGVGSLAQAVVSHYQGRAHVATVEPDSADCVRRSLVAGHPVTVATGTTSMDGLNCGTVSSLAWPVLHAGLSAAVAVSDDDARRAVADLTTLGVEAGPCGAASLAGLRCLPLNRLGLDSRSTVVLLSTEGARP